MKTVISIIVGVLIFIGCFWLASLGINALSTTIEDKDYRSIMKIVLWLVCFGFVTTISIFSGVFLGAFIHALFEMRELKKKRKNYENRRKAEGTRNSF